MMILVRSLLSMTAAAVLLGSCSAGESASAGDQGSSVRAVDDGGRARPDLYQCEGCEGALEADAATLSWQTRMGPPEEPGEPMTLEGTVFAVDGETPAANVVIYAYQTNTAGLYANGSPETEASRRHGRIRGWVRTDEAGRYRFTTIRPAPYPNDTIPAHVHFTILEPNRRPYWIDDIVFDGEFGVTEAYRRSMTNKGGNGIVPAQRQPDGSWRVVRDIILERHPSEAN
jgi:protocatechuate 3,4-dioxygenase, beta subunit